MDEGRPYGLGVWQTLIKEIIVDSWLFCPALAVPEFHLVQRLPSFGVAHVCESHKDQLRSL